MNKISGTLEPFLLVALRAVRACVGIVRAKAGHVASPLDPISR